MRDEYDTNLINSSKLFGVGKYAGQDHVHATTMVYGSAESNRMSAAIILGLLGFGLYWLGDFFSRWSTFDFPYNFIAGFYNLLFVIPVKTFPSVWHWLSMLNITPWVNVNLVISVVGIIFYGFVVFALYSAVLSVFRKKNFDGYEVFGVVVIPALLGFFWFVIAGTLGWLFT